MPTIALLLRLAFATAAAHSPTVVAQAQPGITFLDLSTPDAPESDFPTITAKGRL